MKLFTLLKRQGALSHAEFSERWRAAGAIGLDARAGAAAPIVRNLVAQVPELPFPRDRFDGISVERLDGPSAMLPDRYAGAGGYVDLSESTAVPAQEIVILDRGGGPVKFMSLLRRRKGLDPADFSRYWAGQHAELVQSVPEVCGYFRRYVQNHCIPSASRSLDAGGAGLPIDGIVEIWFDSLADLAMAMTSARYQEVLRPDEEKFVALPNIRLLIEEEG